MPAYVEREPDYEHMAAEVERGREEVRQRRLDGLYGTTAHHAGIYQREQRMRDEAIAHLPADMVCKGCGRTRVEHGPGAACPPGVPVATVEVEDEEPTPVPCPYGMCDSGDHEGCEAEARLMARDYEAWAAL